MNDMLSKVKKSALSNRSIQELAVCAENYKTKQRASCFVGNFKGSPIDADTPYFLASATKLFVTAIVMQLAENKLLDLNAPIVEFFAPGHLDGLHVLQSVDYTSKITVENLLAHTSGLPDYFEQKQRDGNIFASKILQGQDKAYNSDDVIKMVRSGMKPPFIPSTPGRAFYSDTNFQLLGAIIEKVLGVSFADAVKQIITSPLNLENTWVFDANGPEIDRKVLPLRNGDKQLNIPLAMTSVGADGGIVSTAADGLVFIKAFFGGTFFSKDVLAAMSKEWRRIFFPLRYGTGLMLFRLPGILTLFQTQPDLIGHSGISGAFLFAEPENEIFVSGTVNQLSSRSLPYKVLLQAIAAMR